MPVKVRGGHRFVVIEFAERLQHELVGGLQGALVLDEGVVDPRDAGGHQLVVIDFPVALPHGQIERAVQVVVEVGPGGDDPINESGLDQRDQHALHPDGRHRAAERQTDGRLAAKHS
jgi:hypothetical protein